MGLRLQNSPPGPQPVLPSLGTQPSTSLVQPISRVGGSAISGGRGEACIYQGSLGSVCLGSGSCWPFIPYFFPWSSHSQGLSLFLLHFLPLLPPLLLLVSSGKTLRSCKMSTPSLAHEAASSEGRDYCATVLPAQGKDGAPCLEWGLQSSTSYLRLVTETG